MKDKATIAKGEIRSALLNKSSLNKSLNKSTALNNSRYAERELSHTLNNTLSSK